MDKNARRFLRYISPEPNTGCHLWVAAISGDGYGAFSIKGAVVSAHRTAYELFVGPIPDGMLVCHSCDVPICVNPDHLFLGTWKENIQDMWEKGRGVPPRVRGEAVGSAKLTEAQVRSILARLEAGETQAALAREYEVGRTTIYNIMHGHSWRHLAT